MTHRMAALALGVALAGAALAAQQKTPADTPKGNDFHLYFTEGDHVVQIAQRWSPAPDAPGAFYETFEWIPAAARANPAPNRTVPAPGCTATAQQIEANKRAANAFWRDGITPPERIALVDQGYTQHNPTLHRYALEHKLTDYQTLTIFATRGGTQAPLQPITAANGRVLTPMRMERVIAACDVVMQIHRFYVQTPANSGNWTERYAWDVFRVGANSKLVEHWDGTFVNLPLPPAPNASIPAN